MRIPTGLNDGNLYRRRHLQNQDPTPYRRLIRLVVALVLVLVLMKQAGNSKAFRIFFPESGGPADLPELGTENFLTEYSDSSHPQTLEFLVPPLEKTIRRLSVTDQDDLTHLLSSIRQSHSERPLEVDEGLIRRVRDAAVLAGEPLPEDESAEPLGDEVVRMRLQSGLDQAYLKNVADGSIWTKGDNQAFCRLLNDEPLNHLATQKPRYVGVVAMLQQPDAYLRTRVAMNARVARVSKLNASKNDFGITDYFELWLKPSDGSDRPVAFYSQRVPSYVHKLLDVEYIADGPVVHIEGVFLKRLAFRSTEGSQLAPAIVGHFRRREMSPEDIANSLPSTIAKSEPSLSLILIAAAAIGAAIALGIAVSTALSLRRSRLARVANQRLPSDHFSSLATEPQIHEQK